MVRGNNSLSVLKFSNITAKSFSIDVYMVVLRNNYKLSLQGGRITKAGSFIPTICDSSMRKDNGAVAVNAITQQLLGSRLRMSPIFSKQSLNVEPLHVCILK